jgi:hypothetical protein
VYNVVSFALKTETAAFEWGGVIRRPEPDLTALREQVLNGAVDDRIAFW